MDPWRPIGWIILTRWIISGIFALIALSFCCCLGVFPGVLRDKSGKTVTKEEGKEKEPKGKQEKSLHHQMQDQMGKRFRDKERPIEDKEQPIEGELAIKITAKDLCQEYAGFNESAADKKYKGKVLEVIGTISYVGLDLHNASISLEGGDRFLWVKCRFDDKYRGQLTKLNVGQQVTVRGTCGGKSYMVWLKNCIVVAK